MMVGAVLQTCKALYSCTCTYSYKLRISNKDKRCCRRAIIIVCSAVAKCSATYIAGWLCLDSSVKVCMDGSIVCCEREQVMNSGECSEMLFNNG